MIVQRKSREKTTWNPKKNSRSWRGESSAWWTVQVNGGLPRDPACERLLEDMSPKSPGHSPMASGEMLAERLPGLSPDGRFDPTLFRDSFRSKLFHSLRAALRVLRSLSVSRLRLRRAVRPSNTRAMSASLAASWSRILDDGVGDTLVSAAAAA